MTSRYFIRLAYKGTDFCGWQIQPNAMTVQETIEAQLSQLYNRPIKVTGCGRTDTGVHASDFFLHADLENNFSTEDLRFKLENMLPKSIAIKKVYPVADDAHTRFDASSRSYVYKMIFSKDPFRQKTVYKYDQAGRPDFEAMNKAAKLLLEFSSYFPFCKTHADTETYDCKLSHSQWTKISDDEWHYNVTSNRFLRGMVRMIVGMTINVGLGRISLAELKDGMDRQERLERAWAVPAEGLYLNLITYPYI